MLPNLLLIMEFLGIVFTNFFLENFSRMKRSWRKELQLPVTIKRSFLSRRAVNENTCSSDTGSFDSTRSKFFSKVISCFKSISPNEYDLRILLSVFLIEMFDILVKELKFAKEMLLWIVTENTYKIVCAISTCVSWFETVVTNHFVRCFEVIYCKQL